LAARVQDISPELLRVLAGFGENREIRVCSESDMCHKRLVPVLSPIGLSMCVIAGFMHVELMQSCCHSNRTP
jgi:hypothetical protein